MTDTHFRLEMQGPRATLTLDNPPLKNRLLGSDLPGLMTLLDQVEANKDLRVLVLTASGEGSFCAGYDVGKIAPRDWEKNPIEMAADKIEALAIPTICSMNGNCYGAAVDFTLACDFRIGVPAMDVAIPAGRLGVHYWVNGLRRNVERLGLSFAKRLYVGYETFKGPDLLALGYLDQMVPFPELKAATDRYADRVAGLAPLAVQGMKRALNAIARGRLDEKAAQETINACMNSEDAKEGPRAFAEKRKPVFQGR